MANKKRGNPDNNVELWNIMQSVDHKDYDHTKYTEFLIKLTGYSRSMVTSWFAEPERNGEPNPYWRAVPDMVLRHVKLEFGLTEPRYVE